MKQSLTHSNTLSKPVSYGDKPTYTVLNFTIGEARQHVKNLNDLMNEHFGEMTLRDRVKITIEIVKWDKIIDFSSTLNQHLISDYHLNKQPILKEYILNALIEYTQIQGQKINL